TGLLLLAGGSLIYFGRKVEGDVLLEPPRILVVSKARMAKGDGSAILPPPLIAAKGKVWQQNMPMAGGAYRFEVVDGHHQGLTTGDEVTLNVSGTDIPEGKLVTLAQGDTSTSRADLNKHIMLVLQGASVRDKFFNSQLMALTVRTRGTERTFPLQGLP